MIIFSRFERDNARYRYTKCNHFRCPTSPSDAWFSRCGVSPSLWVSTTMLVPSSSDEEDEDYLPQNQQNGKIPSSDASKAKSKTDGGGGLGVPSHGSVR